MSRIANINQRYYACRTLASYGTEIIAVQDRLGRRFDSAVRQLCRQVRLDGPGVWDSLAHSAKVLRWLLITAPMPAGCNDQLRRAVAEVVQQANRLRESVDQVTLVQEVSIAARALVDRDPLVGGVLLDSLMEVGPNSSIVIAASSRSRESLKTWLAPLGVRVLTLGEFQRAKLSAEIAYFVGPPRFFHSAAVTAPLTPEVCFIVPAWFRDLKIPRSPISQYAEGSLKVKAKVYEVEDHDEAVSQPDLTETDLIPEDELLPQIDWGSPTSKNRTPYTNEVEARKVLLSGNRAIWLDDCGERIRTLDPSLPPGERVGFSPVSVVTPGTYLLLREGKAGREALQRRALERLDSRSAEIRRSQSLWKSTLSARLNARGLRETEQELQRRGVSAYRQVQVWRLPEVIRPQSDIDFKLLLDWLGLQAKPIFENATLLKREVLRLSQEIRDQLEEVASLVDVRALERDGHISLDKPGPGLRSMTVTRVLAIAPFTKVLPRNQARVLIAQEGTQWLE